MREMQIDIWSYQGKAVIAITTNGSLTRDGRAIIGRGVARQAAVKFLDLPYRLGKLLKAGGNHVYEIMPGLVSFPVEDTPFSQPDIRLIRRSAEELRQLADQSDWTEVAVPRPGCGGGGMRWNEVKPVLENFFDERFIVVTTDQTHV